MKAGDDSLSLAAKEDINSPRTEPLMTVDYSAGLSAPTIAKAFSPGTITSGGTSTITFTLTNPNGSLLTGANFTDTYPGTMVNTTGLVVGGSCTGRTHTAVAGGSTFNLTAANIPASGNCTVTVDVTSTTTGANLNTTSVLGTNEAPNSAAGGSDTLTVTGPGLPTIAKSFAPATIVVGATSTLTITIDNTQAGAIPLTALALNDSFLPTDVVIAAIPNGANTCGGTLTATAGANNIDLTGGALGAGASCTFQADVTAPSAGAKANNIPAAALNNAESLDAAADANDTLTVNPPPGAEVTLVGSWTDEPLYNTNGFSCTPGAGSNRVVLVMVTAESNAAGTMDMGTVNLGGQALTAIQNPNGVTVGTGGGYHNIVWLGYLDESGIALMSGNAVTMSWDVAPNVTFGEDKVQCATYENVDQTTPVIDEASFSNTSAATIQAGPVAVGEGDRLVYATVAGQPGNHTAPAGYTEHIEQDGPANDLSNASVSRDTTTASPTEDPLASWSLTTRLAIISRRPQLRACHYRAEHRQELCAVDHRRRWHLDFDHHHR